MLQDQLICLDVAKGYFEGSADLLKLIHAKFPNVREHGDRRDSKVYFLKQIHTI